MSLIGIVTVLYNSETVVEEFFETLNNQTFKDFVLYVVDNNSPDNSLEKSKKLAKNCFFKTIFIENSDNYGVAKGNNIGIKKSLEDGCDYVLLSNNDIYLENNTIELLLKNVKNDDAKLAVPKIYYYNSNLIWCAGGKFDRISGMTRHYNVGEEDYGQCDKKKIVEYAPTCFMIISKDVFEKIGIMDEDYFVYFDDTDFMYRAYKAKIPLYYFPESRLFHKESVSTGLKSPFSLYYQMRNIVIYNNKYHSNLYLLYIVFRNIAYLIFKISFTNKFKVLKAGFNGLFDGIKFINNKRNK